MVGAKETGVTTGRRDPYQVARVFEPTAAFNEEDNNGKVVSLYRHNPISNTLEDWIGAEINRFLRPVGLSLPVITRTASDISPEDMNFYQEAVRRAESDVSEFKKAGSR